jgi:hypothetical protein
LKRSPETHHNHDDETGLHLAPAAAVSCQLSAATSLHPNVLVFYVVTCNYHDVMNNNKNSYDEGDVEELRERLSFVY